MTLPNARVVNAGLLYVNGLQLSWSANKLINLAAGQARDSTDIFDIILPKVFDVDGNLLPSAVINGAAVGVNGVDQAVVVDNAMYAVYVIASSTSVFTSSNDLSGGPSPNPLGPLTAAPAVNPYPVAGLLSLAANAVPYLPFGYDCYRRVGWVATGSTGNFVKFWQYAQNDQTRPVYWDVGVPVASAVSSTSFAAVALNTNISPSATASGVAVPPEAVQVLFDVSLAGAAEIDFLPYGSGASAGIVRFASAGAAIDSLIVPSQLNSGVPTIQYKVSASNATLLVTGFVDLL